MDVLTEVDDDEWPACVDGLADLVGWTAGSSFPVDWPVVERSLGGLALAGDYKALVEKFPSGKFRELIKVIRPETSTAHRQRLTRVAGLLRHRSSGWRQTPTGLIDR